MSGLKQLHPDGHDFDSFLFADLGEDRNGASVTVASALARLELDPWKEASELALLGCDAARARLEAHLSKFKDIPTLGAENGALAAKLALLLPKSSSPPDLILAKSVEFRLPRISIGWVLISLFGLYFLFRVYQLAHSG